MVMKKVLIADDDRALSMLLATRCQQIGLSPRVAHNVVSAVTQLAEDPPDLILMDIDMPMSNGCPSDGHGLEMCERLAETWMQGVPVIMLSGHRDEATIRRCRQAGAPYFAKGPNVWEALRTEIQRTLHLDVAAPRPRPQPAPVARNAHNHRDGETGPKILCVDDDREFSMALGLRLRTFGAQPLHAFDGTQAFEIALREHPEIVLTDLNMPCGNGEYLLGCLKSHPQTQGIPVVAVTGLMTPTLMCDLEHVGAAATLTKPFETRQLLDVLHRVAHWPADWSENSESEGHRA